MRSPASLRSMTPSSAGARAAPNSYASVTSNLSAFEAVIG
jgi:hypothetical protein